MVVLIHEIFKNMSPVRLSWSLMIRARLLEDATHPATLDLEAPDEQAKAKGTSNDLLRLWHFEKSLMSPLPLREL